MKPHPILLKHRGFGPLLIVLAMVAFGLAGCGDEDISKVAAAHSGGPLYLLKASGGTINVDGTSWLEPCILDGSNYRKALMTLGPVSTRSEMIYSDAPCTVLLSSNTFNFNVSNDGTQLNVGWVDQSGVATGTPSGHQPTYSVTKVTIFGNDGTGPFSFKTLLLYDNHTAPIELVFGDNSSGLNDDAQGYPTALIVGNNGVLQ